MAQAILDAVAGEPLTKEELTRRLAVHPNVASGALMKLLNRNLIVISGGRVGLPGQLDEGEPMTAEEVQRERFRELWQQSGILAIRPTDLEDGYIRERLCLIGIAMYGRRGARQAR